MPPNAPTPSQLRRVRFSGRATVTIPSTSALPKPQLQRQILRSDPRRNSDATLTTTITGFGLATPLGLDATSTWNSLMAGGSTLDHASVPLDATGEHRLMQLAMCVAREAIAAAHWTSDVISQLD